ncbi:MAG: T9SS type A sorting domain-containing protein [Bacteroidales bacterium]|nr:T9SS type A sorting domain-containing protein [Bacteroidales bacterium]
MMKGLYIVLVNVLFAFVAFGQISTNEKPISFFDKNIPTIDKIERMPILDMETINAEDFFEESEGVPFRFGISHFVNFTTENSGKWYTMDNGDKIWRLAVECPDALSINLLFDKLWLPKDSKLFVYSLDKRKCIGAFTSSNNKGSREDVKGFATQLIYSDKIVLEYYEPSIVEGNAIISVSNIVHGYRYLGEQIGYTILSCPDEVNVNCNEGLSWQNEKNAVAMIVVNGNRVCTGSLINTTENDFRPYLLTANHCLNSADALTTPRLDWIFYWKYEAPNCEDPVEEPTIYSTEGATILANASKGALSDFALLRLEEDPRFLQDVELYYLGWNNSEDATQNAICIHHPKGDIKKISTSNFIPQNFIYSNNTPNYWRIVWSETENGYGITEPGSSGSPLLNENGHIIGQLLGVIGENNYVCDEKYNSIYGKFSKSWVGINYSGNERNLHHWLDPHNSGITISNGISFYPCQNNNVLIKNIQDEDNIISYETYGYGTIIIKSNVVLTITSNLRMAPNSKIIIEPGAKLIIDGGTITSACGSYWEGIYIMGDKTLPQTIGNQGSIVLSNGAVIENARCAIHTWKEDDWNTTGGIVQATNSTFKNNIRSIEFLSYRNHIASDPDIEIDNVSFLRNCTFTWDDDILTTTSQNFNHVSMWEMKGIKIQGCTFKDERRVKDKITTGINTISSVFSVSESLVGTSIHNLTEQNSKFENMTYGIRVGNTSENLPFSVTKSEFKNNYAGIYATHADNLSITNTHFKVKGNNDLLDATYSNKALGLVVESSTGFEIKNNNFKSSTNTQNIGTVGLQVKGSGTQSNLVNNNIFNKLQYATQITQNNNGLKYLCNNFTNCQYGITTLISDTVNTSLGTQGYLRGAATNTFIGNTTDLYADSHTSYTYYYPSIGFAPSHNTRVITRSATPSMLACGTIGVIIDDLPITPVFPNSMNLTSMLNESVANIDELYVSLVAEYGNLYNVPENLLRTLAEHETNEGLKAKEILFFKGLELSYHPIVLDVEDEIIDEDIEIENKMIVNTNNVDNEINLSPNPAKDDITVYSFSTIVRVEILNSNGQEVNRIDASNNELRINISTLASGSYIMRITNNDNNVYTKKFVKE